MGILLEDFGFRAGKLLVGGVACIAILASLAINYLDKENLLHPVEAKDATPVGSPGSSPIALRSPADESYSPRSDGGLSPRASAAMRERASSAEDSEVSLSYQKLVEARKKKKELEAARRELEQMQLKVKSLEERHAKYAASMLDLIQPIQHRKRANSLTDLKSLLQKQEYEQLYGTAP